MVHQVCLSFNQCYRQIAECQMPNAEHQRLCLSCTISWPSLLCTACTSVVLRLIVLLSQPRSVVHPVLDELTHATVQRARASRPRPCVSRVTKPGGETQPSVCSRCWPWPCRHCVVTPVPLPEPLYQQVLVRMMEPM